MTSGQKRKEEPGKQRASERAREREREKEEGETIVRGKQASEKSAAMKGRREGGSRRENGTKSAAGL